MPNYNEILVAANYTGIGFLVFVAIIAVIALFGYIQEKYDDILTVIAYSIFAIICGIGVFAMVLYGFYSLGAWVVSLV